MSKAGNDNIHIATADQIIVASARDRAATIVTEDDRILNYSHVRTVW